MIEKIISGGQTGADQTALEVAKELGIPTGGHCPAGYKTEKGSNPDLYFIYKLQPTTDPNYPTRTRLNVKNSDATLWVGNTTSAGYRCTTRACHDFGKPYIINPEPNKLKLFLISNNVKILNVAGNRASTNPHVVGQTREILKGTLKEV